MASADSRDRFQALDALRFICASVVVLSDIQPLNSSLPHLLKSAIFVGFDGAWAVMAFFVISGLCIHLPQARGRRLDVRSFYAARILRIAIPMLAAIALALLLPHGLANLSEVLWSLYCEIGYYALYPLLLCLFKAFGTIRCLGGAFVLAFGLAVFPDHHDGFLWTYGTAGTIVLGLPVWLLGCLLAEMLVAPSLPAWLPRLATGSLRALVALSGGALRVLHILSPIKLKYSLLAMSPLCALWLLAELRQPRLQALLAGLAAFGSASYSLYLMHKLAQSLVPVVLPGLMVGGLPWWFMTLACAAALTWGFYMAVERPSHRLAQRISQLLRARPLIRSTSAEVDFAGSNGTSATLPP